MILTDIRDKSISDSRLVVSEARLRQKLNNFAKDRTHKNQNHFKLLLREQKQSEIVF